MATALETIRDYIKNQVGYTDEIDPHADLLQMQVLDSFNIVQVAMFVQEHFEIELEADDLVRSNLSSIASIVALVERKTAARPA